MEFVLLALVCVYICLSTCVSVSNITRKVINGFDEIVTVDQKAQGLTD